MAFHEWNIQEIYSNADGTVQFIEMVNPTAATGETVLSGHSISVQLNGTGATRSFNFPSNLVGNTANKTFLIATQGYADLAAASGGALPAPDYILTAFPNGFLFLEGGTINFGPSVDSVSYGFGLALELPTSGAESLVRNNGFGSFVLGTNSPKNFAGLEGTIPPNLEITGTEENDTGAGALVGGAGNDTISGLGGRDVLDGAGGNDTLIGGADDDTMLGGAGNDAFLFSSGLELGGEETILGGDGTDSIRFTSTTPDTTLELSASVSVEKVVIGNGAGLTTGTTALNVDASAVTVSGGFEITGNNGANNITGTGFNDTLAGNAGDDTLTGGLGNDTLDGGAGLSDIAVYSGNSGDYTVETVAGGIQVTGADGVDLLRDVNVLRFDNEDVPVTIPGLFITGTGGNDSLTGGEGDDTLVGGAGADTLLGGDGFDQFLIGSAADLPAGEVIDGGDGSNDTLTYTGLTGANIVLPAGVTNLEMVMAEGLTSSLLAVNWDASAVNDTVSGAGLQIYGTAVANLIRGTQQADFLFGGEGNDTLVGNAGDDFFTSHAGNDSLLGSDGNDIFVTGLTLAEFAGDTVNGGAGSDTLRFSSTDPGTLTLSAQRAVGIETVAISSAIGDPTGTVALNVDATAVTNSLTITGNNGNNTLTGTAHADTLLGIEGDDILNGLAGNDTLAGSFGNDVLSGGIGNDSLDGNVGNDTLNGGAGNDTLNGDIGTDLADYSGLGAGVTVNLGAGSVTGAASGTDTFVGIEGVIGTGFADTLNGNPVAIADTLWGGGGNDTINGGVGFDNLDGGEGNDLFIIEVASHHGPNETISGGAGTNTIRFTSTTGPDVLSLSENVSGITEVEISDATGSNIGTAFLDVDASALEVGLTLTGNNGVNELVGSQGNDTIAGGGGADGLDGQGGDDIFLIGSTVAEYALGEVIDGGSALDNDTIRFTSAVANQTLTLGDVTNVEKVAIANAAGLASGTTALHVDASGIGNALFITGNNGTNRLTGTNFDDTIAGGGGADTLAGGDGEDGFILGSAAEFAAGESISGGAGDDALVYTGAANASLTLTNRVTSVEYIAIASLAGDASGTAAINVNAAALANAVDMSGNDGNNTLVGTGQGDIIFGAGGNDSLVGGGGGDQVVGGSGNDTLTGGTGEDGLFGEGGNDTFIVGAANDVPLGEFIHGGGGDDIIRFNAATTAGGATLTLGENVSDIDAVVIGTPTGTAALNVDVSLSSIAGVLTITGNGGANVLTGNNASQNLVGNGGNDTLNGGAGNDTLNGGAGNDLMRGGDGDDVYVYGAGDILVEVADEGMDLVQSAVTFSLAGAGREHFEHLTLTGAAAINGTGNALANMIAGNAAVNIITGGMGDDNLQGGGGNDVFIIGAGDEHGAGETIIGGDGNDVIRFTAPTGDLTLHAVAVEQVVIGTAAGITTGTGAVNVDASQAANALIIVGNNGANVITGTESGDMLIGNAGNDGLHGNEGNDTLNGGAGAETINGNNGDDVILVASQAEHALGEVINGGDGTDTLRYTGAVAGTFTLGANVSAVEVVEIANAAGSTAGTLAININAAANNDGDTILTLRGNNGNNQLIARAQDDILAGNGGNDILTGGAGTDSMDGGAGNDVFLIGAGEHAALEVVTGGAGVDVIRYTSTIAGALDLGAGVAIEQVVIGTAAGVVTGTTALDVDASAAANLLAITGNNGVNAITGTGFNDTINGNSGDDSLLGGLGNDSLLGGAGNDTLNGGTGADRLFGGAGNDTYENVVPGLGGDVVTEALNMGTDTVRTFATYTLGANLENLELLGGEGTIDLSGTGNTLNNAITGNGGANQLSGLAGNDTLVGADGADTLNGGAGADSMQGGAGDDLVLLNAVADFTGDRMDGGEGTDVLRYTGAVAATLALNVNVDGMERVEISHAAAAVSINASAVENALTIIGNNGANMLTGTEHADGDTLIGNGGADTLTGGGGNDLFLLGATTDFAAGERIDGGAESDTLRYTGTTGAALTLTAFVSNIESVQIADAEGNAGGTAAISINAAAVVTALAMTGNAGANALTGTGQGDTLTGGAGADTLNGGGGNDVLRLGDADYATGEVLNGGAGVDTLRLTGTGQELDLTEVPETDLSGIEIIDLAGGGNTLSLAAADVVAINGGQPLQVDGADGDQVTSPETWQRMDDITIGGIAYVQLLSTVAVGGVGANLFLHPDVTFQGSLVFSSTLDPDNFTGLAGDDVFLITSPDHHAGDTLDGGAGNDSIFFNAASFQELVLESTVTSIEEVRISDDVGNTSGVFPNNVDASAVGYGLTIVGNNGNNILTGTSSGDTVVGGGGGDNITGGAGQDSILGGSGVDFIVMSVASGHTDTIDAGADGGYLGLVGTLANTATVDLTQADQFTDGGTDTLVQTGFIHVDALNALGFGLSIIGNDAGNTLSGSGQADTISGGLGDDAINGSGGEDTLTGGDGNDFLNGGAGNDSIEAGIGDDDIFGGLGTDRLDAGAGNDTLTGDGSSDTMDGGAGNDLYVRNGTELILDELADGGTDTVHSSTSYTLAQNLEVLVLLGAAVDGTGNGIGNTIIGNGLANVLDGAGGGDSLVGGAGNDTVEGGAGNDTLAGSDGTDSLSGGADADLLDGGIDADTLDGGDANDTLLGMAGDDRLLGGTDADSLDGGAGTDTLEGGAGDDSYVLSDADLIIEDSGEDTVHVFFSGYTLADGVENLTLNGIATSGTGNGLANRLTANTLLASTLNGAGGTDTIVGSAFNDSLDGGAGIDSLTGGLGNDHYFVDDTTDIVLETVPENLGGGVDVVHSTANYTLSSEVEQLVLEGSANLTGIGNTLDNTITGNTGNNFIDGLAGSDTYFGGAGDDTYVLGVGDRAIDIGGGADTVLVAFTYTLGSGDSTIGVENVTLTGDAPIDATGDDGSNLLTGNSAANYLRALRALGGLGDTLIGGGGNDTLDGGDSSANATLMGGSGDDTYMVNGDVVVEEADSGTDTIVLVLPGSGITLPDHVENLVGSGIGNALANHMSNGTSLSGLGGNDTLVGMFTMDMLDGGTGVDSMIGGGGADLYFVDDPGDIVIENAGEGFDTVTGAMSLSLASFTNVESLALQGSGNFNATGAAGDDFLIGNTGNNVLSGGGGHDTLSDLAGIDTLDGGAGNDTLGGGADADVLNGGDDDDKLIWDPLDSSVNGGEGFDTVAVTGLGFTLDLTGIGDGLIQDVEAIDLANGAEFAHTLTLSATDVLAISTTSDVLRVDGVIQDTVTVADGGWAFDGHVTIGSQTYAQYTSGLAVLQVDLDVRRLVMPPLPALSIEDLDGTNGFTIVGANAGDISGFSVSDAGDVDGDGFDDILIGAPYAGSFAGATYVIFGDGSFDPVLDLSALNGANGFRLSGVAGGASPPDGDRSGTTVSSADDINADGFSDVLVGAFRADPNGNVSGASYAVLGSDAAFASDVPLSGLDGTQGFRLAGAAAEDLSGRGISGVGDVNGDGYDDLVVGSYGADPNGSFSGAAYVVFGSAGGFANMSLSEVNGTNGFKLSGASADDFAGFAVSGAGDVNGDGFDDIFVSAHGADPGGNFSGAAYVVFGAAGGLGAEFQLSAVNGTNGFKLSGGAAFAAAGSALSGAGDVNGDGFGDIIVSAPAGSGTSYVVFGKAGGFAANLELSSLDGTSGFRIVGEAGLDRSGISVSGAGDVNGDGLDDLLIGAYRADLAGTDSGAAYLIFGKSGGFGALLDLSSPTGDEGYRISGLAASDALGRSVSGAGDVNGDGFDDILIGAPYADPGGRSAAGASYVIFGSDLTGDVDFLGTAGNDTQGGTAADEILVGGQGIDEMSGGGGADVLHGGAGGDFLIFDGADRLVDGGSGEDTLRFAGSGETLDLTGISNLKHTGIEIVDLTGTGNNTLTLGLGDVLDLSDTTNTLRVDGNAGDVVNSAAQGWVADPGNPETIGANDYNRYTSSAAILLIDTDITQTNVT